jgi:DNA-binding GntR family transcriptional regulator
MRGRMGTSLPGRAPRAQSVTEKIRDRILRGVFPPETHLQEIPLARKLGVSRTPIRVALTALAQEGLLTYAPRKELVRFGHAASGVIWTS